MRKDIEIHINTGDIALTSQDNHVARDFCWIDAPADKESRYIYGEISIAAQINEDRILREGIYLTIPYTPVNKEIRLRIKRVYSSANVQYIRNPVDGSDWFVVSTYLYGQSKVNLCASELIRVSEDVFYLRFDDGELLLYSGGEVDLNIVGANTQNRNLLLKCVPGNNLRYPLTGVGLVRWINGNATISELANILKSQFAEDGTPVRNARYDFDSGSLYMDIDTSNVDKNGELQS